MGKKYGQVLLGGLPAYDIGPNFIQPTIFTGVQDHSDINQLEVFGPVLVLHEFEGEEEAISRANDSECKCSRAHVAGREADSCSSRWPLRQCLHQRY
jgi:acyl-CoA reductase-like NAD-dependent aldehyde dehydrogenase